jgi:hypothetical protein
VLARAHRLRKWLREHGVKAESGLCVEPRSLLSVTRARGILAGCPN